MAVFTALLACVMHLLADTGGLDNFGRSFLIPFGENLGETHHRLILTAKQNATVYINNPAASPDEIVTKHTVQPGSSLQVELGGSVAVTTNQVVEKKAVLVVASQPIAAYGLSLSKGSSDGYLALPTEALGTHYVVATYDTIDIMGASQIVVAAAEDDTLVTVTVRVNEATMCGDVELRKKDRVAIHFRLNAQEEVRVLCDGDITGSHVNSTKPVAVISGNKCAQVPVNQKYCDHLVEMMIPVYALGTRYLLHTFPGRDGAFFRVVPSHPETQISYGAELQPEVLGDVAFHHFQLRENQTGVLSADKPVLVVGYTLGQTSKSDVGDPFMTLLPSPDLAPADYFLDLDLNPSSYTSKGSTDLSFACYVTAVVKSEYSEGLKVGLQTLAMDSAEDNLYVGSWRIDSWPIRVHHTNPEANVALTTHCSTVGEGVGFPVGYTLIEEDPVTGNDDVCLSSPCANGGICYGVGRDSYRCHCLDVFGGPTCQDDIVNECNSSSCFNGATCQDGFRSYTCICPPQFTGYTCSDAIPATTTAPTTLPPQTTTPTATTPTAEIPDLTTTSEQTTAGDTTINTPATAPPPTTEVKLKATPPPPQHLCPCSCTRHEQYSREKAVPVEIQKKEIAREIKEELSVDAKNTSKGRNRQQSSPDRRVSATGVALVSISLVAAVVGFIVITDAATLVSHVVGIVRQRKRKEQQRPLAAERSLKVIDLDNIPAAEKEAEEIELGKPADTELVVSASPAEAQKQRASPFLTAHGPRSVSISDSTRDYRGDGLACVEMTRLAESAARVAREKSGRWRSDSEGGFGGGGGDEGGTRGGGGESSFVGCVLTDLGKGKRGRGSGDGGGGRSPPRHRGSRRKHLLHVRPDTILLHVTKAPARAARVEDTL